MGFKANAQHYKHFSLWTRVQGIVNLDKNWISTNTILWRRQNNFHENSYNPTVSPLLLGVQTQFSRFNQKRNFILHAAQITLMYSDQLLGKEADFNVPQNREWRWAGGVEFVQRPSKKLTLNERFLQELRVLSSNQNQAVGRIRGRIVGTYRFNPSMALVGVSELVMHDPPQLTNQQPQFRYHQLWLGGGFIWRLNPHVNLETSYTFINTRRNSKIEFDDTSVINLYLTIR